jgi:indole-3-glycerol phosphate synthase
MGILEEICARRRERIRELRSQIRYAELEGSALWSDPRRGLAAALRRADGEGARFLAEVKRASPSAGPIRPGADPAAIAREYTEAGARALSILTEPDYFDGDPAFLARARAEVDLPLLMKDFVVDEWQIAWARSLGADAVLLIVAALDPVLLRDLAHAARDVGLETLIEVHDEPECERALEAEAGLIGMNQRNLRTFEIDRSIPERLLSRIPRDRVRVAESGIRTREDVVALERAGFDALLVGETLMRATSPGAALRVLRGEAPER